MGFLWWPIRLRCEMATQQYLMDYHQGRYLDRLLDAVQFMTSLIRYNKTIGRQNEAGLAGWEVSTVVSGRLFASRRRL